MIVLAVWTLGSRPAARAAGPGSPRDVFLRPRACHSPAIGPGCERRACHAVALRELFVEPEAALAGDDVALADGLQRLRPDFGTGPSGDDRRRRIELREPF